MKGMEIEKPTEWMRSLSFMQRSWRTRYYIELYYADDYSLQEFDGVSRQAVYDNIKRTEKILEDYEMKLHMYSITLYAARFWSDFVNAIRKILF